jgi:multidrug efflux pump subunit AcrA (membrane-fusion protein)
MTAILSIPVAAADNVLAVPLSAVFTEKGERYAYVKTEGDKYERRPVIIGISDLSYAEVQQGLSEGETVALELPPEERGPKKPPSDDKRLANGGKNGTAATTQKPSKKPAL